MQQAKKMTEPEEDKTIEENEVERPQKKKALVHIVSRTVTEEKSSEC